MNIVAVTACPTGIAHSYMAAEGLETSARAAGDTIHVEVQGAMGIENRLPEQAIREADLVILAIGVAISGMDRFEGKTIYKINPHKVLSDSAHALATAKASVANG